MKILLTSILLTMTFCVLAQRVPYGLLEKNVQSELLSKFNDFDSLIVWDKASYWKDDMRISGLAFKGKQIKKLTMTFKPGKLSFYDMKLNDVKTEKISNPITIESILKLNLPSVLTFNTDSLNRKPVWDISDQNVWTIIFIRGNEMTIKQSYAPEVYQPILPTNDRRCFMDLYDKIDSAAINCCQQSQ